MKKKQLQELREKTDNNLQKELRDEKAKLSDLRFDLSLGKVTNIKTIKKIKENVAQILTVIGEKRGTAQNSARKK